MALKETLHRRFVIGTGAISLLALAGVATTFAAQSSFAQTPDPTPTTTAPSGGSTTPGGSATPSTGETPGTDSANPDCPNMGAGGTHSGTKPTTGSKPTPDTGTSFRRGASTSNIY